MCLNGTEHKIYSVTVTKDGDKYYSDEFDVDLKTVGKWSGLFDTDDQAIFEDDFVLGTFKSNNFKTCFKVIFQNGSFLFDNGYVQVPFTEILSPKVIGNVYEDAVLLESYNAGKKK